MDGTEQRDHREQQLEPLFRATGCNPPECVGDFQRQSHTPYSSGDAVMAKRNPKPCSAMVEVIRHKSPFGEGGPYSFLPVDLHSPLLLLMIRLTDSADDGGVVADFCACFHLEKKAVLAAVKAYRHASRTMH
jgi:hypothetical protein